MSIPYLYAIINLEDSPNILEFVSKLLSAGVRLIQLRAKLLEESGFYILSRDILKLVRSYSDARLIVNDNIDLCKAINADGVHLGQTDTSPIKARKILGNQAIIGYSTHTIAQVESVPFDVLNYIAFGPVFFSSTKSGHAEVTGVSELERATKSSLLPVVAIGGITENNVHEVYRAGAQSAAVISALSKSSNLNQTIEKFLSAYSSSSLPKFSGSPNNIGGS